MPRRPLAPVELPSPWEDPWTDPDPMTAAPPTTATAGEARPAPMPGNRHYQASKAAGGPLGTRGRAELLADALAVLGALDAVPRTAADVAARAGLAPWTTGRALRALVAAGEATSTRGPRPPRRGAVPLVYARAGAAAAPEALSAPSDPATLARDLLARAEALAALVRDSEARPPALAAVMVLREVVAALDAGR